MKVLLDMNLSPDWIHALAEAGIPATHWSSVGHAKALDAEIMAYARGHDQVVLTNDLDFGITLAMTEGDKPSVVQIRSQDLEISVIGPRVIAALLACTLDLEQGALLTVSPGKVRTRVLPLRRALQ